MNQAQLNLHFNNNASQPISRRFLPKVLTKTYCGLAVVHNDDAKLNDGRIPAVV